MAQTTNSCNLGNCLPENSIAVSTDSQYNSLREISGVKITKMKRVMVILIYMLLLPSIALADLTVYFLDVQQGDSAIIVCDGEAMIIDGGLPGQSGKIYSFITNKLRFNSFVYIVATHPDNDHIGGLPAVLEATKELNKKAKYIYSPVDKNDSPRFTDLVNKAKENKVKIKKPSDRDRIDLGEAKVTFLNCTDKTKSDSFSLTSWFKSRFLRDDPEEDKENNDISLVVKVVYKETTFLFTGDIEKEAEQRLIGSGVNLQADVIKIAHHGSSNSSSFDFLSKVKPKYAVISCGTGNRYGHPHQETLDRLKQMDVDLYRTDLQGLITCTSDGHSIEFQVEKPAKSDVFTAPEKK